MSDGLDALEARIGHVFRDRALLVHALTHSSLSSEEVDLERLEFLGDRVLGLLTAEALCARHPGMSEGELAPRLNALVRRETCAKAALAFGLDAVLRLSPQEDAAGGRRKTAILGDACEGFLGALYVDGGLEAARKAFDLFWTPNLDALSRGHRDAKTALQEWSQERRLGAPHYEVVSSGGPAHAPAFDLEVQVPGFKPARGAGKSKREAQMQAAEAFLLREGVWTDHDRN
ncbi:MAG: ribonuclease III [Parvularculaceae bacterium]|nr:ribonuclease III [Parvularculaceae bacterium]